MPSERPRRSQADQRLEFGAYLVKHLGGRFRNVVAATSLPITALDMIGQYDALHRQSFRKANLKGLAFGMLGDRTDQTKPDLGVVGTRRQHQTRSPARLFAPNLGREGQSDQIAGVGNSGAITRLRARRPSPSPFRHGGSPV